MEEQGKARKGLPSAVEITLRLTNEDMLTTVTDIPGSSMNEFDSFVNPLLNGYFSTTPAIFYN